MKTVRALAVAVALGLAAGGTAQAVDNVSITKHNLSLNTNAIYQTNTQEVCVFCHTPHGASPDAPLWNRAMPAGPFTMYSSPTIEMTIAGSPQGVSLACLSCHDGTIALDALRNTPGSGTTWAGFPSGNPPSAGYTFVGAGPGNVFPSGKISNLGQDLRDDHPISVTYDPTKDPAFNTIASVTTAGLRFYGAAKNQVECASCHNPHDSTNGMFLRKANAMSALCTTCHIK